MTDKNHPITPPPELVEQWTRYQGFESPEVLWRQIADQAARWGADQELEACINYFHEYDPSWGEDSELITGLRAARRPKPPNLKERALSELDALENMGTCNSDTIRRALEQLDD